jgi:hypothetical protein
MEYEKINDTTLQVKKPVETKEETKTYDYDFLIQQEKNIQAQKDRENEQRDLELSEVRELIEQCESLGIKSNNLIQTNDEIEKGDTGNSEKLST